MALHRLTALALAGGLALGVSACGGETPPEMAPSTTPATASPSPTATGPVAPVLPELAKREDAVGAKAFVKFYFAAVTYAMKTGDTTVMEQYAAKDCAACAGISKKIHKIYDPGGRNEGGGWVVKQVVEIGLSTPQMRRFVAAVVQPAQTLIDPEGQKGHSEGRRTFSFNVWALPSADGWLLREIQEVPRVE